MSSLGVKNRSITAGTTHDVTVTQNTGRQYLFIQNLHATAVAWIRIDGGATAVTAVAGAAGTIRLGPGDALVFEGNFVPTGNISIISDTASTPVTVIEG